MLVLLDENGLMVISDESSLFRLVLRVAKREIVPRDWSELADREVAWIAEWIHDNSRRTEKVNAPSNGANSGKSLAASTRPAS